MISCTLKFIFLAFTNFVFLKSGEIEFPPPFQHSYDGHLKPFGWQSKPESHVRQYDHFLTASQLYKHHVKPGVPLVYRGVIRASPAITMWSDDYLTEKYGDLDVLVERKSEDRSCSTGRMRFRRFLKEYRSSDIYVVSLLPVEMMTDVQAVSSVLCGTFHENAHEADLWMSNGGTRSVIHYDADENFHCLIDGRKDFIVTENRFSEQLAVYQQEETAGSSFSPINPDAVDLHQYPGVKDVSWMYATLKAGDCIYLPKRYIHQVRSYGRTVAVTTLFTQGLHPKFDDDACRDVFDAGKFYSMRDIEFDWTYEKGQQTIDMGYMNIEYIRQFVKTLVGPSDTMSLDDFRTHFLSFSNEENTTAADIAFDVLSRGKPGLSVFDVEELTRNELKFLGRAFDPPHGPSTLRGEEVYILPCQTKDSSSYMESVNTTSEGKIEL